VHVPTRCVVFFVVFAFAHQYAFGSDPLSDPLIYKLTVVKSVDWMPSSKSQNKSGSELLLSENLDNCSSRFEDQHKPESVLPLDSKIHLFGLSELFAFPFQGLNANPSFPANLTAEKRQAVAPIFSGPTSPAPSLDLDYAVNDPLQMTDVLHGFPMVLHVPVSKLIVFGTMNHLQLFFGTGEDVEFGLPEPNNRNVMRYAIKATREEIASLGDISLVHVQIPDLNDFANVINKSGVFNGSQKRPSITIQVQKTFIPTVIPFPSPTPKEKELDCEPEGELCFHTDGTVSLTVTNPCTGLGIEVASNGASLVFNGIQFGITINVTFIMNASDQGTLPIKDEGNSIWERVLKEGAGNH
jgi:hypothetical protein